MNRIVIQDFLGGMYNASDPESIPDNACTLIENYEYKDMRYPQKRMGTTPSELDYLSGSIKAIAVWNPRVMPNNCTGDRVYVVAMDDVIMLVYQAEDGLHEKYMFTDLHPDSEVRLYPTQERVLIADTRNNGRFIAIDKDGNAYSDIIGILAPTTIPYISASGDDNFYSDTSELDTGMSVERGVILQYCYTIEDKYGVESNPSPIATQKTMAYKYPDTVPPGFKYYWYRTKVTNLSCAEYPQETKDRLRYYNIYRRDIDFREGVIAKQFVLVGRVPIDPTGVGSYTDSSSLSLADISYNNNPAPMAKMAAERSGVIFMAGIETPSIVFPFKFDRYVEIAINNNNSTDYVAPIIQVKLTKSACGVSSFDPYLSSPNKIRIIAQDMRTPVPVVCKLNDGDLDCYIMPPYLNRESINRLYLCLANDEDGVTNPLWDTYNHGKFFVYGEDYWGSQPIFDISRPMRLGHYICTNVPYPFSFIPNHGSLFNLSAMHQNGKVKKLNGSTSEYVPAENDYTVAPYGEETVISNRAYRLRADRRIEYEVLVSPNPPILIVYEGTFVPVGLRSLALGQLYSELITCGNFIITAWYLSSMGVVRIGYRVKSATAIPSYTVITDIASHASKAPITIKLIAYLKKRSLKLRMHISTAVATATVNYDSPAFSLDVELSKKLVINNPEDKDDYYSVNDNNMYHVSRFDLMEMPDLSESEAARLIDATEKGATFFRAPIGKSDSGDFANENISFENKSVVQEPGANTVVWSNISGSSFPSLNSKIFAEPVTGIVIAPSYMRMQYQNTLVVFTRNTLSRIILADDLASMAASITNEIEEYSSGGLYAPGSLCTGGGALFWLSENGVLRWDRDGLSNISFGVMDIPVHKNYASVWIDARSQYLLHDKTSGISYVFHDQIQKWTVFTGLGIDKTASVNFGEEVENKAIFISNDGDIVEYPSTSPDENANYRIKSKVFYLGNRRIVRYRLRVGSVDSTSALVSNDLFGAEPAAYTAANPERFKWIMLPITAWGESVQFLVDNSTGLRSIEIDLKEGV